MNEREALKAEADLVVPEDTRILSFNYVQAGERSIRAKLSIANDKLAPFLKANGLDQAKFSTAYHGFLGSNGGEWDPASWPPFPVYMRPMIEGRALYIGLREDGPSKVVYVFWFRT